MCTGLSGYKPVSLNMCNRRKEKEKKTMIWEESMCNTLKARRPTNSVFILQTLRLLEHSPEHTIQLFLCDICTNGRISYLLSVYHFTFKCCLQVSGLNKVPGVFLYLLNCLDYPLEFFNTFSSKTYMP